MGQVRAEVIGSGKGKNVKMCGIAAGALALAAAMVLSPATAHAGDPFVKPTAEELSMTSLPGYPGAPAVVLFEEEVTKDDLHVDQVYKRIKILTEKGKEYANVELPFVSVGGFSEYADQTTLGEIVGRTIHPDGTIIPFTGKPYLRTLVKQGDVKVQQKVFTLPEVEVGSIIEYRYASRYADGVVKAPNWYLQGDLYVKSAHFEWWPSKSEVGSESGVASMIYWYPVLPPGVTVERRTISSVKAEENDQHVMELHARDIAPQPSEEFMPPIKSLSYRVLFYYSPYKTGQEYWKQTGARWSKRVDAFEGPNDALKAATQTIVGGATTDEEKLRKIYAAVMALENTSYTRSRDANENKADGLKKVNTAADVLTLKRGDSSQLAELFVGMARAAGLKAYLMLVPDRSQRMFVPQWLSFEQFDDAVAIVNVGGQDKFFDPGSRYCAFGHLAWNHTLTSGLRQAESGPEFANTPGESFQSNKTSRTAYLSMNETGGVEGTITLSFEGAPALAWRQKALTGDEEGMRKDLRESIQGMVPKTLEVTVTGVKGLADYDAPLVASLRAKGTLGSSAGKRVMMPVDLFTANASATFPHDKRETNVDLRYGEMVNDTMRVALPKNLQMEGAPGAAKFDLPKTAAYSLKVTGADDVVLTQRSFAIGPVFVPLKDYPALKTFYGQLEARDQDSIVLKTAAATTAAAAVATTGGGQ